MKEISALAEDLGRLMREATSMRSFTFRRMAGFRRKTTGSVPRFIRSQVASIPPKSAIALTYAAYRWLVLAIVAQKYIKDFCVGVLRAHKETILYGETWDEDTRNFDAYVDVIVLITSAYGF
jgi:hypothetical protein